MAVKNQLLREYWRPANSSTCLRQRPRLRALPDDGCKAVYTAVRHPASGRSASRPVDAWTACASREVRARSPSADPMPAPAFGESLHTCAPFAIRRPGSPHSYEDQLYPKRRITRQHDHAVPVENRREDQYAWPSAR